MNESDEGDDEDEGELISSDSELFRLAAEDGDDEDDEEDDVDKLTTGVMFVFDEEA